MVSPKSKTSQKMLIDEVNNASKKIKKQKSNHKKYNKIISAREIKKMIEVSIIGFGFYE